MKKTLCALACALMLTLLCAGALAESAFDQGLAAYNAGDYEEAYAQWLTAAQEDNAIAMYNIGYLYENGYGVEQDDKLAMGWYRKSAKRGNAPAMNNLGRMYENGRGTESDYEEALYWYQKGAEGGEASSMSNLGRMYVNGYGVEVDEAQAVSWFEMAWENGYDGVTAYEWLGYLYSGNSEAVEADYQRAVLAYEEAAVRGSGYAANNLGNIYDKGNGVEQDDTKAAYWYEEAAYLGNTSAMYSIGVRYNSGRGVERDDETAVSWFEEAAWNGNQSASVYEWIGYLYALDSQTLAADYEKAVDAYEKAIELGSTFALNAMGALYEAGNGVEKDLDEALRYYQMAAEAGHEGASEAVERLGGQ